MHSQKNCIWKVQQIQKFNVGVFKQLLSYFKLWKYSKNFFKHDNFVTLTNNTIFGIYVALRHIINRQIDHSIRVRIYAVALYNLRFEMNKNDSLQFRFDVKKKLNKSFLICHLTMNRWKINQNKRKYFWNSKKKEKNCGR